MFKLLVGALLALTAANTMAGTMYIYKNKEGQLLSINVNPNSSGNSDKFTKKLKTTYHKNDSLADVSYRTNSTTVIEPIKNSKNVTVDSMGFEVPYGYRLPTKADNVGDWKRFNAPNHLKSDFNGDGIEDEAYILPKEGSELGYGVFVSINRVKGGIQTGRKFHMFKLTGDDGMMRPQSFAIELAEPSDEIFESACGTGYWQCAIGEPAEFKIKNPSIIFCYIESACTMYLWDNDKSSFKEIKFSD